MKLLPNLVLFLNNIRILEQLGMFFNDFYNLILVLWNLNQGIEGIGQKVSFQLLE